MTQSLILGVGFWGQAIRWRQNWFRGSKGRCHGNHFWLYMRCTLAPPGEYDWTVHVRWRCGLMSNYFDHLLLLLPWFWPANELINRHVLSLGSDSIFEVSCTAPQATFHVAASHCLACGLWVGNHCLTHRLHILHEWCALLSIWILFCWQLTELSVVCCYLNCSFHSLV